jgi:hypothetical protein
MTLQRAELCALLALYFRASGLVCDASAGLFAELLRHRTFMGQLEAERYHGEIHFFDFPACARRAETRSENPRKNATAAAS